MTMYATEVFSHFVDAIRRHDVEALVRLMTPDHVFMDSLGNRVQGAAAMRAGWQGYFSLCADYWIRLHHIVADGSLILATGEAGGTIDGIAWKTPAAFQCLIHQDRVLEWRVFADNKPVYKILALPK
jgi:ketosteroid isomerase-like protein